MKKTKFQRQGIAAVMVCLSLSASPAAASELTYRPNNPNFGGSPLNGSYLMGQAVAQDRSKDKSASGSSSASASLAAATAGRSASDIFKSTLQARLVGAMANSVVDAIYGPNAQDHGEFTIDGMSITFQRIDGQIRVVVSDGGGETVISLPATIQTQ